MEKQEILRHYCIYEGTDNVQFGSARADTPFKPGHDAGLTVLENRA